MTDKTCGTCRNWIPNIWCRTGPGACFGSDIVIEHRAGDACCSDYSERADSVEQVAAEMLDSYARLYSRVGLRGCQKSEAQACISPTAFYNRLLALGVTP